VSSCRVKLTTGSCILQKPILLQESRVSGDLSGILQRGKGSQHCSSAKEPERKIVQLLGGEGDEEEEHMAVSI